MSEDDHDLKASELAPPAWTHPPCVTSLRPTSAVPEARAVAANIDLTPTSALPEGKRKVHECIATAAIPNSGSVFKLSRLSKQKVSTLLSRNKLKVQSLLNGEDFAILKV